MSPKKVRLLAALLAALATAMSLSGIAAIARRDLPLVVLEEVVVTVSKQMLHDSFSPVPPAPPTMIADAGL
jgi:hypothetical protein